MAVMKSNSPLDTDPMDFIVNDDGDVVAPAEVHMRRNNWAENRSTLELDHPGFASGSVDQLQADTGYIMTNEVATRPEGIPEEAWLMIQAFRERHPTTGNGFGREGLSKSAALIQADTDQAFAKRNS
jgi:hypothetical protein